MLLKYVAPRYLTTICKKSLSFARYLTWRIGWESNHPPFFKIVVNNIVPEFSTKEETPLPKAIHGIKHFLSLYISQIYNILLVTF